MNFQINKVATEGCEIRNASGQVIGWSVDGNWARIMTEAMKMYIDYIGITAVISEQKDERR